MKITSQATLPIEPSTDTAPSQRSRATKSRAATKADQVSISQAAKDLAGVGDSSVSAARQEKIAALKRSIDNGTYRVEPEKVAKAILTEITIANKTSGKL